MPNKDQERKKILFIFGSLAILFTPAYIYSYWKLGAAHASVAVMFVIPPIMLTYFVWRFTRSLVWAGNWIVALGYGLFFGVSFYTGGIESPSLTWSLAVPIVATLICGIRSGLVWLILVLAKLILFYVFSTQGIVFEQEFSDPAHYQLAYVITITGICVFMFLLAAVSEMFKNRYLNQLEQINARLNEALERVKILKGLIPICAWCKKVRDDKGFWGQVETYLNTQLDAKFSHGICPDCEAKQTREWKRS